ncbi:MAG: alpha-amylase family glycosyl hydrolase [Novosphingobium sp.]|uniref:alpha-amylase family glycosyl hydrolase n=1 Tax=Novosphingobium sp. TaxID=1874826 RepID=UPI0030175375
MMSARKGWRWLAGAALAGALAFSAGTAPASAAPVTARSANLSDDVVYHVFVRSWRDSNGDRIGDLNGIASRIGYLKSLGVTAVLLTPLYPSRVYHNYFATSFEGIEPAYGSMADFRRLLAALHHAGIKLYLDMEFQYVVDGHPWWREALADPASAAGDRLLWQDRARGVLADGPFGLRAFDHFGGDRQNVTTVNLKAPAVRAYFDKYLMDWVDPNHDGRFDDGVDGFRLDHMMDDLDSRGLLTDLFTEFWKPAFDHLRAANPRLSFIAEQADWNDSGAGYLTRADTSAVFGFTLEKAIRQFDKAAIVAAITALERATPPGKHQLLFPENHDIDRIASDPGMTAEKLRTAAALVFFLKGTPIVYQGQELGMKGQRDTAYKTDEAEIPLREAFKWASSDAAPGQATWYRRPGARYWDQRQARDHDGVSVAEQSGRAGSLLEHYRKLAKLRWSLPALRRGDQKVLESPADLLVVRRCGAGQCLYLAVNLSARTVTYRGPGSRRADLIGGGGARLRPWQAVLLR